MKVLILGAGASARAGYPLASGLMQELAAMCSREGAALFEGWQDWIRFKDSVDDRLRILLESPNPEVVISTLDLFESAIQDHRISINVSPDASKKSFRELELLRQGRWARLFLVEGLVRYFRLKHESDNPPKAAARREYLNAILRPLEKGDVVLTFNWDVLVERCLSSQGRWTPADGYGLKVELLRNHRPLTRSPGSSEVTVLKLHGSVGWHLEPSGLPQLVFDGAGVFADLGFPCDNHPVQVMNGDVPLSLDEYRENFADYFLQVPLMLYPSFLKRVDSRDFQGVWVEAASALARADEVDVYGYSLPETDIGARTLLNPLRFRLEDKKAIVRIHDMSRSTLGRWRRFLGDVEEIEETLGQ